MDAAAWTLSSPPEHTTRIAADDEIAILSGKRQLLDAGDAVEIAHVERIIAAEQDMMRADRGDQECQRRPGMQDGVVEQPAHRVLRRMREVDARLRTHREAVPEATGLVGQKAAAMGEADLQPGMALEHAAEHQARAGDRRLERKPDQVLEIKTAEPLARRTRMRMDEDEGAERGRRRPERLQRRVIEIAAVDIGSDHRALQPQSLHGALELGCRELRRLQRDPAEPEESPRVALDFGGDLVVLQRCAG